MNTYIHKYFERFILVSIRQHWIDKNKTLQRECEMSYITEIYIRRSVGPDEIVVGETLETTKGETNTALAEISNIMGSVTLEAREVKQYLL